MKTYHSFLLTCFLFSCAFLSSNLCFTQAIISGQVVDAETSQPLEGASVFAQNTTKGVITNKEGNYRIQLSKGGYELIISFTGYANKTITIEANEDKRLDIALKKEDKSMNEVVIKSSNEVPDGLNKYGQFFIDHFIGTTPSAKQCTIQNPQALKFYYSKRNDKLKVLATEPLQISNMALGYNLRYELDSFVYYYKTDINSYRGNCCMQIWKAALNSNSNGRRLVKTYTTDPDYTSFALIMIVL